VARNIRVSVAMSIMTVIFFFFQDWLAAADHRAVHVRTRTPFSFAVNIATAMYAERSGELPTEAAAKLERQTCT
jgi:hypothetical protein